MRRPAAHWLGILVWFVASLGQASTTRPDAVIVQQNGNTVNVELGEDGNIYFDWESAQTGIWSGWASLGNAGGGIATLPAVLVQPSGNTVVTAAGADGNLYLNWENVTNSVWSGWQNLGTAGGGFKVMPAMIEQQNGTTVLVEVGADSNVYFNWQRSNGTWAGWGSLGSAGDGFTTTPAVLVQPNGNTVVTVIGADGDLCLNWENVTNSVWSGWQNLGAAGGGFWSTPAIVEQQNGNMVLVAVGLDQNMYVNWQMSNGMWAGWGSLGGAGGGFTTAPAALVQPSGNTVVIAVGTDGNLYLNWQNASTEAWSGWSNLGLAGGGFTTPAMIEQHNGSTVLVDIGADKNAYFDWQKPDGTWAGWGGLSDAGGGFLSLVSIFGQVTTGGSGLSGVTVSLTDNTAVGTSVSRTTNTGSNGNYAFSVLIGSYTLTPLRSGYAFSPASQTFNNVSANQTAQATRAAGGSSTPPSCLDISPGYLGTSQLSGAGTFTATATVSTSVTAVTFQIYNEQTQSISTASPYKGNLSSSSSVLGYNQYTMTLPFSSFQTLGSYAVTAQVQDSNGNKAMCPLSNSGFFAIVNDNAEPSSLNGQSNAKCGTLAGSWTDQAGIQSGETTDRWDLTQSGNKISGTQTVSNGPSCGNIVWQVSGTVLDSTKGTFSLTATNPSVAEDQCGYVSATNVTINPLTVSGPACDSASGTEDDTYPPGYGSDSFSTTWNGTATIPTGETSQFDQWGPDGYSNQGLFKGLLTTSGGSAEFSGRQVQEYFPEDLADGCAALDPNKVVTQHASGAGSKWTVQGDSTYTDDWIGYGPALTRYYQTYVGSCSLVAPQQVMRISSDNSQWVQYKTNRLEYDITATGATAKRDTASQNRTYPQ